MNKHSYQLVGVKITGNTLELTPVVTALYESRWSAFLDGVEYHKVRQLDPTNDVTNTVVIAELEQTDTQTNVITIHELYPEQLQRFAQQVLCGAMTFNIRKQEYLKHQVEGG